MSLRRPTALIALLLVVLLLLTGCEVRLAVDIAIDDDGGGEVELTIDLDEEAVANGPEDLAAVLRTGDLRDNGWVIDGPTFEDGAATINARKTFSTEDQLQQVLDEITGANGMFQDFAVARTTEFALTEYRLTGDIDLRKGEDLFNDAATTALLSGNPFGKPSEEYLESGQTLDDAVPVTVRVSMPGEGDEGSRSNATFQPRFDDEQPTDVTMATVDDNFLARLLRWIGFAALALFALATVLGLLGFFLESRAKKRAPRVRAPQPMASRVPMAGPAAGGLRAQQPQARPVAQQRAQPATNRQLRFVVLDPIGVLYDLTDEPAELAVATARRNGSETDSNEILAMYRELVLGRMSTAEFWEACGVYEDPEILDQDHVSQFRPRTGAAEFLREMQRRQMPVSCLTNDAAEWSRMLRERDNLAFIEPWIVSADVGAIKPDPGLYEAMRRQIGTPYEGCLSIDTVADHLDAAKTLGMQTAYMTSGRPAGSDRPNHPIIGSFSDFFRRR